MTRKLTEVEWKEAMKKWLDISLGHINDEGCVCCNLYIHNDNCNGCPLVLKGWHETDDIVVGCKAPKHPWLKWFKNMTNKNALAVFEFIAERYMKNKKANK